MLGQSQPIPSLADFTQNSSDYVQRLTETGVPLVLSVDDSTEVVMLDGKTYRHMIELIDQLESIEAIREGLASIERGEGMSVEEFDEQFRRKHNFPSEP